MKIGSQLKFWRENKNITYYRVAQSSGVDADYIKRIETSTSDNDPNITIETLEKLALAIGVQPFDLVCPSREITKLSQHEQILLALFRRYSDQEQEAIVNLLEVVSKHGDQDDSQ